MLLVILCVGWCDGYRWFWNSVERLFGIRDDDFSEFGDRWGIWWMLIMWVVL